MYLLSILGDSFSQTILRKFNVFKIKITLKKKKKMKPKFLSKKTCSLKHFPKESIHPKFYSTEYKN